MPSFVSTLAGLLAVLGLQLYILGESGSINLPYGSAMVNFGQSLFMPHAVAYVIAALAGILTFVTGYRTATRRQAAGLSSQSLNKLLFRGIIVVVVLEALAFYLNQTAGSPGCLASLSAWLSR